MNDKLLIPEKIKVGYQERSDTYTQKLAYVIYYDAKGVLRKEKSWQGWREDEIPFDDYENVPTEGFVLNKGVGGVRQSYGWNTRNEYVRVYDPRGFEFEISVSNLLFILQECTSTKGKGLEGEFVYSWAGKELVLLPVSTQEYKVSTEYTSLQDTKIGARELQAGCSYLTKQMGNLTYIGRFMYYKTEYGDSTHRNWDYVVNGKKGHIFYNEETDNFTHLKAMTSLAKLNSDVPVSNYAEIMDKFNNSKHSSFPNGFVPETLDLNLPSSLKDKVSGTNQFGNGTLDLNLPSSLKDKGWGSKVLKVFTKVNDIEYNMFEISEDYYNRYKGGTTYKLKGNYSFTMTDKGLKVVSINGDIERYFSSKMTTLLSDYWGSYYTKEDLEGLGFIDLKIVLENGGLAEPDTYTSVDY